MASRLSFLGTFWLGLVAPLTSGLFRKVSRSVWMLTVRLVLKTGSSAVDTPMSHVSARGWTPLYGPSLRIWAMTCSRCDTVTAFSPRSWKICSSKSDWQHRAREKNTSRESLCRPKNSNYKNKMKTFCGSN